MKLQDYNTNLLPIFTGTYESMWEVREIDDNGEELEVDYDFKEFMSSITHVYSSFEEEIIRDLDVPFIKKIKFKGTFYSPREYNFSTDCLDFDLTVDKRLLLKTVKGLESNQEFKDYLRENFRSRDGFISYTPDQWEDIYSEIKHEGEELYQSISAVIRFLVDGDTFNDIEEMIHEDWQGNGYGGLDYKII